MSNFTCEYCGTEILESPQGYVTGCDHYPMDKRRALTKEEKWLLIATGIATCSDIDVEDEKDDLRNPK